MDSMLALRSAFMNTHCLHRFQDNGERPVRSLVVSSSRKADHSIKVGILGASGLIGGQLIPFVADHPLMDITLLTAATEAGQSIGSVFPHLKTLDMPDLVALHDADFSGLDAVFCCLPPGTSQEIIKGLPNGLKIVDLSEDFLLRNVNEYAKLHHQVHKAQELQKEAVYGLAEIYRKKIQNARLVANPGCYSTAILLPLIPLMRASLIELQHITISSHLGAGGAARTPIEGILYPEVSKGASYFAFSGQRYGPEIKQELSAAANARVDIKFDASITSMSRGLVSVIYVRMAPGVSVEYLKYILKQIYKKEEFVEVVDEDPLPEDVQGSNRCCIKVFDIGTPGRVIVGTAVIISVIDHLVKGGSGQAVQNLNLMMGIPENTGLGKIRSVLKSGS